MQKTFDNAKFHIVLVQAIIFNDNKYLMGRRSAEELQDPGEWAVPGGKVEKHFDHEDDIVIKTLRREIREEVGVEVEDDFYLVSNGSFTRHDKAHVVGLTFLVKYKSGKPEPGEETVEVKWMSLDEIKKIGIPAHTMKVLQAAEEYRKKLFNSKF